MLLVKQHMMVPSSKQLLDALNTMAGNLDIPLQLVPHLERIWSNKRERARATSGEGGMRVYVRETARLLARCMDGRGHDPHRVARSGEQGELGRMLRSQNLQLNAPSPELLKTPLFYYLDEGGGPLRLIDVGALVAFPEMDGAGKAKKAPFASQLIGVSFGYYLDGTQQPHCGGELRAGDKQQIQSGAIEGEARGYVRVPWGEPKRHRLAPAEAASVTRGMLTGCQLEPVRSTAHDDTTTLMRVRWESSDQALGFIRSLLPDGALVLSVGGASPSAGTPPSAVSPAERIDRLAAALRNGECVVAEALSLQDVARRAHRFAPRVRLAGMRGRRSGVKGRFQSDKARRAVPMQERVNRWGNTSAPAAARAVTQPLQLFLYHQDNPLLTPDAAGGRKIKVAKEGGVATHLAWTATQAAAKSTREQAKSELAAKVAKEAPAGTKEAKEAKEKVATAAKAALEAAAQLANSEALRERFNLLYEHASDLLVDDKQSYNAGLLAIPKQKGRPNTQDKGLATDGQWGQYESALPSRLGCKDPRWCGGDNRDLKPVKSFFQRMATDRPVEVMMNELLYRVHTDTFDWNELVVRGGRDGGGGGGSGGDGGGGGGGGGDGGDTAADRRKATLKAALRDERHIHNTLKQRTIRLQECTTAATIDHEVASGLLPELMALLHESKAKLTLLNAEALNLMQPDAPSTPLRRRCASNDEDDEREDFSDLPQHAAISPAASLLGQGDDSGYNSAEDDTYDPSEDDEGYEDDEDLVSDDGPSDGSADDED